MRKVKEKSKDQARWNQYGIEMIRKIEKDPEKYIISNCPLSKSQAYNETIRLLSPIEGKRILELGCGHGEFSVWLSKQRAKVNAVDIGSDLVASAKILARVNHVDCKFEQGNIIDLPFDSSIYDVVIGISILRHLSEADVLKALRECYRVLKAGSIAIFHEPVENSKLFNFIQNLFPVGKNGSDFYRPSILYRKAWANYIKTVDIEV